MQARLPESHPINALDKRQLMAAKILAFFPPLHKLAPKIFRPLFFVMDRLLGMPYCKLYKVQDFVVPFTGDSHGKIRAYYPTEHSEKNSTMVYFHGGGCVIGSIASHDRFCRHLAKHAQLNILSVDYRLAPEYKFPVPILDAISAWNWVMENHQSLNINPQQIGVGGDSAGAYLACLIGLKAEQAPLPIQVINLPKFQFLLYPMLNLQGNTPSYLRSNKDLILTNHLMDYFKHHYLNAQDEPTNPLVSPLHSQYLTHSPATYLLTLEFDPLRDDGVAFAEYLTEKNCVLTHEHLNDCMHGFISIVRISPRAKQASERLANALAKLAKQNRN